MHIPTFGDVPVDRVDTPLISQVIKPLWNSKPDTADRLRARIERILAQATGAGHRTGENPARWKDHFETLLPPFSSTKRTVRQATGRDEHYAALSYAPIGASIAKLRQRDSVPAKALEFVILTCCRSGEVRGARWSEIDLAEKLWVIPEERMKKGDREHRVRLSAAAMEILQRISVPRRQRLCLSWRQTRPASQRKHADDLSAPHGCGRPLGSRDRARVSQRLLGLVHRANQFLVRGARDGAEVDPVCATAGAAS
jgi:integrase